MRDRDRLEPWLIVASVAVGVLAIVMMVIVIIDRVEAY